MSTNVEILKNYWQKEAEKDVDGIIACYQPDATFKAPISDHLKGTDALTEFYKGVVDGFAKSRVEINRATEADDVVAAEFTLYFVTHEGNKGQANGCNVFTIRDGKIQDVKCYFNPADFSA